MPTILRSPLSDRVFVPEVSLFGVDAVFLTRSHSPPFGDVGLARGTAEPDL